MTTIDDLLAGLTPVTPQAPAPALTGVTRVDLALPLLPQQCEAVERVLSTGYGYLGMTMGTGKTPTAIGVIASVRAADPASTFLVVVPPSLRTNWQREVAKFAPWLTTAVLHGKAPSDDYVLPTADVLILGDSSIKGWSEYLADKITGLVVDEAHRFKNKSQRSKALIALAKHVPGVRVCMSGTPTPNGRHMELANQIEVLGRKAWDAIGGKGRFWNYYAPQVDAWGGRGSAYGDELYQAMAGSWYYRVTLQQVNPDMPNKSRSTIAMEGKGRAVRQYVSAEDDLIAWLQEEGRSADGAARAEALVRFTTLRKLAGEAKVDAALEHIKDVLDDGPGGVFVVAEHSDVIDRLVMGLAKYNPTCVRGGMTDADKQAEVDDFVSGASRVMVGQITSAGVGLTLHGGGKNTRVVVVQLPWTPAELTQAEDRLWRLGQTNDVEVEILLAAIDGRWTIDERLWGMLETKHFAAGSIQDGKGEFLLSEVYEGLLDSYR
jgi:SWI/SNF-related matrix-associated actin-dependent regulator of chromatin subfamily A-like protein 1